MDQTRTKNLIIRFVSGECNDNEQKELLAWINQSSENRKVYLEIKDIFDSSRFVKDFGNEQLILFYKNKYEESRKSRSLFLQWTIPVAAILLVGLLISLLFPKKSVYQHENLQVFTVPLGSRSSVLLSDGTEISLNSGSKLSYSSNFSSQNRTVTLSGEAFFHVKSDSVHPFTVKTKDFDISVTGTQLNVCSYHEDLFSSTTLAEGKVNLEIHDTDQLISVMPGEKFLLDRNARQYSLTATNVEQDVAWKDGQFIFKNIPFPELIKRLERWYDVKLTFSDLRLSRYSYSGRFKNQETIWQVLDAIKMTSPINYHKTNFREFIINYKSIY
ncbi:MAG: FecR domain-containing protein [Bacteroidota bacterium]